MAVNSSKFTSKWCKYLLHLSSKNSRSRTFCDNLFRILVFFKLWQSMRSSRPECSVKKVFLKFRKIYRKTPAPESPFNKVAGLPLRPKTPLKRDSGTGFFLWILQNLLKQLFLENTSGGCFYCMAYQNFLDLQICKFWNFATSKGQNLKVLCCKFKWIFQQKQRFWSLFFLES